MPEINASDPLEELLGRHLEHRAAALDLAPGDLDAVPQRAHRQVRRTRLVRNGLAACCSVLLVAVAVGVGLTRDDNAGVTSAGVIDTAGGGTVERVEDVPVSGSSQPGEAVLFAGSLWSVSYEGESPLLRSDDGTTWTAVDIPELTQLSIGALENFGRTIVANDDHLALLLVGADGATAVSTADGESWQTTDLGVDGAWLGPTASSPTHLFTVLQPLTEGARERSRLDQATNTAMEETFPGYDGYGVTAASDGDETELDVSVDGENIFRGPISESGLPAEVIEYLSDQSSQSMPPDETTGYSALSSPDGVTWSEVDLPEGAFDQAQVYQSNIGLVVYDREVGAMRTNDGITFDALPALGQFNSVERIVASPFGVFVQANGGVYRADDLDGPFGLVDVGPAAASGSQAQVAISPSGVAILVIGYDYDESFHDMDHAPSTSIAEANPLAGFEDLVTVIERDGVSIEMVLSTGVTILLADGREIFYSAAELDSAVPSDNLVVDEETGQATFLDPTDGAALATITPDELFRAIAEQHPQYADAVDELLAARESAVGNESTSSYSVAHGAPVDDGQVTMTAFVSTDGIDFRTVPLDHDADYTWASVIPTPGGSFVFTFFDDAGNTAGVMVDPS